MKTNSRLICLMIACLLLAGCATPQEPQDFPTPPASTTGHVPQISPYTRPQVKNLLTPDAQNDTLNAQGPWLLISTNQGLFAANPNGSGLKQLTHSELSLASLEDAVQPNGHRVAFITSSGALHHLALNLVSLPDGRLTKVGDLTSAKTERSADAGPGDPGFESIRAVGQQRSFAWSPDGKKLAFGGFMDGPSADIYLYDSQSGKITRITKEKSNDFNPSWAPDGRHILFLSADSFGTGAGMNMTGVWSAAPDGSQVAMLYRPDSTGETIHGWVDRNTVVLSSASPTCSSAILRLYNIANQAKKILQTPCFKAAAVNPDGNVLFGGEQGLFIQLRDAPAPTLLLPGNVIQAVWDKNSVLFAARFEDNRLVTLDHSGKYSLVSPVSSIKAAASNGSSWAWSSDDEQKPGVWVGRRGEQPQQIFSEKASFPMWDASNYLLFFSGSQLYRSDYPDYTQASAGAALNAGVEDVTWVAEK